MLDPYTYRANETLAKADPSLAWRARAHVVDHFERIGFPVRINSIQEVRPLINSMQENRFDLYMDEMGGLTAAEYACLMGACCGIVDFQKKFFPQAVPVLPLSVLMSVLCLRKKILGIDPKVRSILELGPGCGYLSLFELSTVSSYVQVEACESFYILQSLVSKHWFGSFFKEHAFFPDATGVCTFWTPEGQVEVPPAIVLPDHSPVCEHFPWWHIEKLFERKFKIVTSNANLLEFTPDALADYLRLISTVLQPDGVLLAQCCGSHVHGTPDQLFQKAEVFGLELVAQPKFNNIHNALWVRKGSSPPADLVHRVFTDRPTKKTIYTMQQIVDEVIARL